MNGRPAAVQRWELFPFLNDGSVLWIRAKITMISGAQYAALGNLQSHVE